MNFDFMFAADRQSSTIALSALAEGVAGRIVGIRPGDALDLERLEVMGLCAGRSVEVAKRGDPMIVRVLGTRIGLAAQLASRIIVEPHARGPR